MGKLLARIERENVHYSGISVTDRVNINEQNRSIVTGPLYKQAEFKAIWTLLSEDVAVLKPMGIGPRNIGTELVQDTKLYSYIKDGVV